MEVYLEVTYLINMMLILLSFEILCFLLNIQMNKKELLTYMLTYNISLLLLYIDFFDGFLLLYNLLITFFYFRRLTYIYYPIYTFIYISLLSFSQFILPHSLIFQCILLIEGINGISLLILGLFVVVIIYFYICFCHHKITQEEFVDVTYNHQQFKGFIDNGNKVFYKGYPVIFIASHLLEKVRVIDTILITTACSQESIDVVFIDDIEINHQVFHHVYVGVLKKCEYDCILNLEFMGGLL